MHPLASPNSRLCPPTPSDLPVLKQCATAPTALQRLQHYSELAGVPLEVTFLRQAWQSSTGVRYHVNYLMVVVQSQRDLNDLPLDDITLL